jgi:hypothetical protein
MRRHELVDVLAGSEAQDAFCLPKEIASQVELDRTSTLELELVILSQRSNDASRQGPLTRSLDHPRARRCASSDHRLDASRCMDQQEKGKIPRLADTVRTSQTISIHWTVIHTAL